MAKVPRPRSRARRFAALLLALALPALSSGCCTILLWEEGVPELRPEKVLAASFSEERLLTLAIERSDGDRSVYLLDCRYGHATTLPRVGPWDGTLPPSAGAIHLVDDPRLAPDGPLQRASGAATLAEPTAVSQQPQLHAPVEPLWIGRNTGGSAIYVVPDRGTGETWVAWIEGSGETDWTHPGTWGAVVATPVTAAVDLVTLPFQLIFFYFFFPDCC